MYYVNYLKVKDNSVQFKAIKTYLNKIQTFLILKESLNFSKITQFRLN